MMMNIFYINIQIANTYKINGKLKELLLKLNQKIHKKMMIKRKYIMMIICLVMKPQQRIITVIIKITTTIFHLHKKNKIQHYINQEILKL